MKEFLKKNFTIIVLVLAVLTFFKSCGDSRALSKMNKQMETLVTKEEMLVTKEEMAKELRRSGLEAEKRMIQATDRKLLDVRRQTEIEEELKKLDSK